MNNTNENPCDRTGHDHSNGAHTPDCAYTIAKALPVAPDDALADDAWKKIMDLAEKHALVVQAYGGSATLATPAAQRDAGIRNKCLRMARFREE